MDFNTARFNMVQQQIRTWNVLDLHILDLLGTTPREKFVPKPYQLLAFSDTSIPIGYNQVMLPPKLVGRILQSINLQPEETILEIGTGTGYMTALLSQLAQEVVSFEIIPALAKEARQNIKTLNLQNTLIEVGDGVNGYLNKHAPFDAIVLTGSLPFLPRILREQLAIQGRLFAVVGNGPAMSAMLLTRIDEEQWEEKCLFETEIPPLTHPTIQHFQF